LFSYLNHAVLIAFFGRKLLVAVAAEASLKAPDMLHLKVILCFFFLEVREVLKCSFEHKKDLISAVSQM